MWHRLFRLIGIIVITHATVLVAGDRPRPEPSAMERIELDSNAFVEYIYRLRPDDRPCPPPECGGWWIRAMNHFYNRCADGSFERECYVAQVSWRALGLDGDDLFTVMQAAYDSGAVLLGTVTLESFHPGSHHDPAHGWELGVLTPSLSWVSANNNVPWGGYYWSERVYGAPNNYLSTMVNFTNWHMHFHHLDYSIVGAHPDQIKIAEFIAETDRLLTAGYFEYPVTSTRAFFVTQFYLPVPFPDPTSN